MIKKYKEFINESVPGDIIEGDIVDIINNDFFEGETADRGQVIEILLSNPNKMIVQLDSDPTIKCMVEYRDGRWEIIENV